MGGGGRYAEVRIKEAGIIDVEVIGPLTEAGFRDYLDELLATMRRLERFSVVLKQGRLQSWPVRYTGISSRWLVRAEQELGSRWVSTAFVLPNPVLRAVTHTLFWAARSRLVVSIFETEPEAYVWTRDQLAKGAATNVS